MPTPAKHSQALPASASNLLWAAFILLLALCLCLALLFLLDNRESVDLTQLLPNPWLGAAVCVQLLTTFLFILAWRLLLAAHPGQQFSLAEATAHIGVTLTGKYLPGKVWGLLGRTYLLRARGLSTGAAMNLLAADQFLTFYSGLALGLVALAAAASWHSAVALALPLVLLTPFILRRWDGLTRYLLRRFRLLLRRLTDTGEVELRPIRAGLLNLAMLVYLLHWLGTALVLFLLFLPLLDDAVALNLTLLVAAVPLALLAGFVALWAPGGIGVREGIMIAILSLNLPWELALSVAVAYRCICVVTDLVTGAFALIYLSRKSPLTLPG